MKGRLNQDRIIANQSGSFLIFGFQTTEPFEDGNEIFNIYRITIPKEMKKDILNELDLIKINNRTVYPSMETPPSTLRRKTSQSSKITNKISSLLKKRRFSSK